MRNIIGPTLLLTAALPVLFVPGALAHEDESHARHFPSERLEPAVDKEGIINTSWASVPEHLAWDAAMLLGYSNDPLFTYTLSSGGQPLDRKDVLVENRLTGHLTGAIALFDWVQLGLEVPVLLFQQRDETRVPGEDAGAVGVSGFGDLRIYPKARILRQRDGAPLDIGLQIPVSLPTGQATDYFGEQGFTFSPTLLASREWEVGGGILRAAGNIGTRMRTEDAALPDGQNVASTELLTRVGVGYVMEVSEGHPTEIALGLASAATIAGFLEEIPVRNPSEILGEVDYTISGPLSAFAGGAVGVVAGAGGPDFRVFGGVRFASRSPADKDGDGILDKTDKCTTKPENKNGFEDEDGCPDTEDTDGDGNRDDTDKCINEAEDKDGFEDDDGCPDLDHDKDGIPNDADKCVDQPEDKDTFEDDDGCPEEDNDKDGVLDGADKCIDVPEDKDGFQDDDGCPDDDNDADGLKDGADRCPLEAGPRENHGCPDADRDGDTVVDRLDNCPDEKGDPSNAGCVVKQLVILKAEKIEILDKVFFKTGKDVIEKKSFPLLDNIVTVLKSHPEIQHIRVEGHTDDVGTPESNKDLSDRRAKSVAVYLTSKGLEASRVVGVGYGLEKPIADNASEDGKAQNRRVEFVIVQEE
ncbi:MAG: OmpA family protein [Deltaproteobacteria bacterium]|nr:OmpA family protein [Deltaproteobacteria bacterium]